MNVRRGSVFRLSADQALGVFRAWGGEALNRLQASEPLHDEVEAVSAGSLRELQPRAIQESGYMVKSLEAAPWAFQGAQNFREAVLRAVNLGDDAATTGAVCGQLAGAFWGESGIPSDWLDGLARRDMIDTAMAGLLGGSFSYGYGVNDSRQVVGYSEQSDEDGGRTRAFRWTDMNGNGEADPQ